jgi:hypothetical protein
MSGFFHCFRPCGDKVMVSFLSEEDGDGDDYDEYFKILIKDGYSDKHKSKLHVLGRVRAIGPDVTDFEVGDCVIYSTYGKQGMSIEKEDDTKPPKGMPKTNEHCSSVFIFSQNEILTKVSLYD